MKASRPFRIHFGCGIAFAALRISEALEIVEKKVHFGKRKSRFDFHPHGSTPQADLREERLKMKSAMYERMVAHVNRKLWWHVPPIDPDAYEKRGKFLASSFGEAEFWGRPLYDPQRVSVAMPLVGDEETIERRLFGKCVSTTEITVDQRFKLDARMKRAALAQGYDSILLMGAKSFHKFKSTGKVPRSLELNLLRVS